MKMFLQLLKVDEKTGIVSGRACEEILDHAGEIFDYAKSKPHFEAWSANIAKATDGKSAGNVRAMHGKVSAGILKDIQFNDAEKAIDVTALINDPVEKAKLFAGNYTGFSIGGSYAEKWEDPEHAGVMRYEAIPAEISIVDLPCVPTATFTAIKADGSTELRKFHPDSAASDAPSRQDNADSASASAAESVPTGLSKDDRARLTKLLAEQALLIEDANASALKALAAQIEEIATAKNESVGDVLKRLSIAQADYEAALSKVAERSDTSPKEGESKYGDVKFADEKNNKYPIDTPAHIRAAWNYINKPKNEAKYDAKDVKTIKSKIVAAWKDKIDAAGPPSAEKAYAAISDVYKFAAIDSRAAFLAKHEPAQRLLATLNAAYGKPEIAKGMWTVADLACLVDSLQWIAASAQSEAEWEGDNSAIPGELRDSVKELAGLLGDMVDEEVEELVSQYEGLDTMIEVDVIELAAKVGDLVKAETFDDATLAHMGAMHEALGKALSIEVEKAVAAVAAPQTLNKITKAVLDETTTALSKARTEIKTQLEKIDTLQKRVKELEKMPAARAPVLRVIGKGESGSAVPGTAVIEGDADEVSPVMSPDGKVDKFATQIKKQRFSKSR